MVPSFYFSSPRLALLHFCSLPAFLGRKSQSRISQQLGGPSLGRLKATVRYWDQVPYTSVLCLTHRIAFKNLQIFFFPYNRALAFHEMPRDLATLEPYRHHRLSVVALLTRASCSPYCLDPGSSLDLSPLWGTEARAVPFPPGSISSATSFFTAMLLLFWEQKGQLLRVNREVRLPL